MTEPGLEPIPPLLGAWARPTSSRTSCIISVLVRVRVPPSCSQHRRISHHELIVQYSYETTSTRTRSDYERKRTTSTSRRRRRHSLAQPSRTSTLVQSGSSKGSSQVQASHIHPQRPSSATTTVILVTVRCTDNPSAAAVRHTNLIESR